MRRHSILSPLIASMVLAASFSISTAVARSTESDPPTCPICTDEPALAGTNCNKGPGSQRHRKMSALGYEGWYMGAHGGTSTWYCGDCGIHASCPNGSPPPGGDEEETEIGAVLRSQDPAELLALTESLGAAAFVERSSGMLVVLNCLGEIAQQYKLTADQTALLLD
jgi:hypothetical protein